MKEKLISILPHIITFLIVFFSSISASLFAIGFLILADTFTGIWASWKKHGRSSITSRKAGRIVAKFIIYPLSIIVAKVSQEYLAPAIPWVDVTTGILAMVEVKSIFENMSLILGFDLWDKLKKAIWKDKQSIN